MMMTTMMQDNDGPTPERPPLDNAAKQHKPTTTRGPPILICLVPSAGIVSADNDSDT